MLLGDRYDISVKRPMPVIDISQSTKTTDISTETVTFSDGAAGTTQKLKLTYDNILSEYGDRIGDFNDTSLSWTTGTVLTTEVEWRFKNVPGKDNDTARLATMANGEFMVDYENGYILGKNATTTSTSTDVVDYKVRRQEINATINVGDIEIGAVELKDASTTNRAVIDTSGNLSVAIAAFATIEGCDTLFDADGDNTAQVIKAAAGALYGLEVSNANSTDAWIQIFDVAAGSVTVGTTTPTLSFLVPAGNGTDDGGMTETFVVPIKFATAITYACSTTPTGSGDPTTGLVVNVLYK